MAQVIVQAFADTQGVKIWEPENRASDDPFFADEAEAMADGGRFFVDGRMEMYADAAGVNPEYVRRLYADAVGHLALAA